MKQKVHSRIVVGLLGLVVMWASPSFGQETPAPATDLWKGNLELSYIQTGGNTESKTLATAGKAERMFERGKLIGEFNAIYGENEGESTDKAWMARGKYDYFISSRAFAYISETFERNVFKGVEIRYTTQAGAGYSFIKTPSDRLDGELGVGYIRENPIARDPTDTTPPIDQLHDLGYMTGRAYGVYEHAFSETTRFLQTAEYLPALEQGQGFLFREESSIVANLMGNLALKVSYAVFYDSEPQPGFFKTDQLFKTSLLYTF
jgi:putative salt-induced outer membrane protein